MAHDPRHRTIPPATARRKAGRGHADRPLSPRDAALLEAWLDTSVPLQQLHYYHDVNVIELARWASEPRNAALLHDLEQKAARRADALLAEAQVIAAARLAQLDNDRQG